MTAIQAVFLDRDGTIGGTGHFIHPRDFELYPFAQEAIDRLRTAGVKVFAVTNQHRISKGQATVKEFGEHFQGFGFDDWYICPHGDGNECDCRKPKPGMLIQAAEDYELDLTKCVVVGDSGNTDMIAAHEVGALKVLVLTGWGKGSLREFRHTWGHVEPDYIAKDLREAVEWIIEGKFEEGRNFI